MSNIYIQEPPTNGKVLLVTSVGDIDVELWSKEAPRAARNFVQLCLEGYYDGTIFHRVIRDFIVQGGDPTGTGHSGESVYGHPFKDEIHTRLRFVRRGLVAMANSGPNDNGSQFFFTMGSTPELMNRHTIFGKVAGQTVFNMLKLQDCEIGANERPMYPHKIIRTEILSNPFDDIVPRSVKKPKGEEDADKKPKSKSKATKNFSLLSFGEEAEEDEEEVNKATKDMKGKSKSSHDLIDDPKLSSVPALGSEEKEKLKRKKSDTGIEDYDGFELDDEGKERVKEQIKKKLKKDPDDHQEKKEVAEKEAPAVVDIKKEPGDHDEKKLDEKATRREEIKQEVIKLEKELVEAKKKVKENKTEPPPKDNVIAEYKKERQKYIDMKKQQGRKGSTREQLTLEILAKFQSRLSAAKHMAGEYDDEEEDEEKKEEGEEEEEDIAAGDISWLRHKLQFEDHKKKVIDPHINDEDRYEISDPRNPMTKRRREASKQTLKEKR